MKKRGILIAFEGIDGTGKSSQIKLLADYLRQVGHEVVCTREPTDGRYGQRIRELYVDRSKASLEEELELFIRDRQEHVSGLINPALDGGKIVLTDRYYFSTAAYQGAAGCDPAMVFARNSFAPEPDLVLLLTMDPSVSMVRIRDLRGEDLNDFEQEDQLRRVAALFDSFDQPCIVRINAEQPLDDVWSDVQKTVAAFLAQKR
jgi:dTMP kinase